MKTASITVDLNALATLCHGCAGCPQNEPCCCAHYDICISAREMERIIGYLPQAAIYCPQLKTQDGYDNVFEQIGRNLFRIETTDEGLCVFAYHRHPETRCALHSIALDLGLPLALIKPEPCILWPLALSETAPYTLSVDEDAFQFTCNRPQTRQKTLHASIQGIITTVFGKHFTREVESALDRGESPAPLVLESKHHRQKQR